MNHIKYHHVLNKTTGIKRFIFASNWRLFVAIVGISTAMLAVSMISPKSFADTPGPNDTEPYFVVQGGDAMSGYLFGLSDAGGCYPTNGTGTSFDTWNYNDVNNSGYFGGAVQGDIITSDVIAGAVSDLNSAAPASPLSNYDYSGAAGGSPNYLSFANQQESAPEANNGYDYPWSYPLSPGSGYYGGNFDGSNSALCQPDGYSAAMNDNPTALPTTALNGNVLNLSQLAGGTYRYRGTLIINDNINGNNTPISDVSTGGVPITLAVDGDVYIESDITYSYSSPNNIPQLNVYASGAEQPPSPYYPDYFYVDIGNIYVQNDVTEIHGYFAAEGDQVDLIPAQDYGHAWADLSTYVFGDGLFADCAMIDPATGIITTYADSGTCNRQLDIDGSVGANVVYLERSYGGLQPEASFACATNADCAAEVFQYSPEVWVPDAVGTSCVGTASQCIGDSYESVTYLPPSL